MFLCDFVSYLTKSFDVLTGDQKLEVRTASYGPEIDQSQHVKSVSHIIKLIIGLQLRIQNVCNNTTIKLTEL